MSILKLGSVVHKSLNYIHDQIDVTLYMYLNQAISDSGRYSASYSTLESRARMNPLSDNLIQKNNLEIGKTYKVFYFLTEFLATLNRNIGTSGDYIETPDSLKYRIVKVPEVFDGSGWQQVIGIQSDEINT